MRDYFFAQNRTNNREISTTHPTENRTHSLCMSLSDYDVMVQRKTY